MNNISSISIQTNNKNTSSFLFKSKREEIVFSHDYCNILLQNVEGRHGSLQPDDQVIFLNAFDGAEMYRSNKACGSVISYSTSIQVPRLIQSKIMSPHASKYCLTWQQLSGKEDLRTIVASTASYFKYRREVERRSIKLQNLHDSNETYVYDMHDGKLLYVLIGSASITGSLHASARMVKV